MTICVGILCKDGVVMASDTMASNQILGFNNKKIYNTERGLCAIAGDDSLGKLLVHKLNLTMHKHAAILDPYAIYCKNSSFHLSCANKCEPFGSINT